MKNRRNLVLILAFLKVRAFTCDSEIYDNIACPKEKTFVYENDTKEYTEEDLKA